jgi:hypothetical protein
MLARHVDDVRIEVDRMPKDLDGVSLAPVGLGSIRELWISFVPCQDHEP